MSEMISVPRELLDRPAEQHQGEPVALPARRDPVGGTLAGGYSFVQAKKDRGWNACLDEIAKLGPLYAHPAPAQAGLIGVVRESAERGYQVRWTQDGKQALSEGLHLYTHPAPSVQKRYSSRPGSENHDGTTLAVLTLGAFDASELGDIDIQVRMENAESLQQKLVSAEDIHVELVSAEWARGLEQEVEDCWGTIDKMHMQALGAEDRAKEIADLRAKLAERDAALSAIREACENENSHGYIDMLAADALSASAEPSTSTSCGACGGCQLDKESPSAERDERAQFEAAYERGDLLCMDGPYDNPRKNQCLAVWQARAALERKP